MVVNNDLAASMSGEGVLQRVGGRMTAELVLNVLGDGSYRRHLEVVRNRLSVAMLEVSAKLKNLGVTPRLEPQAGMFLWCQLPDCIDAADVARAALEKKIVMAPGNVFSLSQSATSFMRFNLSQTLAPRVFDVLRDLLAGLAN
jgi:DNA-binding transcriptional MocR family regulator